MGDRDGNFNVTPCQTPGIAAISGRYWRRQFESAQRGETGAYAWYMRIGFASLTLRVTLKGVQRYIVMSTARLQTDKHKSADKTVPQWLPDWRRFSPVMWAGDMVIRQTGRGGLMCFQRHLICRRQIHPLPELLVGGLARQRIARRKRGFHHQRPALGGGQMR